jgi:type IV secretion system protein VirB4
MRSYAERIERTAERCLPYEGHLNPHVVVLRGDLLLAMGRAHGLSLHELSAVNERNAQARILSALHRQIADDGLTIYLHLVRHQHVEMPPAPQFRSPFAAELAHVYRERVLRGQVFANEWFVSTVFAPRNPLGTAVGGKQIARTRSRLRKQRAEIDPERLTEIEELWHTLLRSLDGYELVRLGLRQSGAAVRSEIAEALHLILGGDPEPAPLVQGPLGSLVYTDDMIFGRRAFEIRLPDRSRYGAIFGFREYMPRTWPGIIDAVYGLPMPLVMTQSFAFLNRTTAVNRSGLQSGRMTEGGDHALSQIQALKEEQDALASGHAVKGVHHFSLAIYADSLPELNRRAALARTMLAEAGAKIAQERNPGAMEGSVFAQLPGNTHLIPRPGAINSRNFAHLANLAAFPKGGKTGRWGPAMMRFKTTAGTAYDYCPHVGEVGLTFCAGRVGSGKSTWLLFWLLMVGQYMGDNGVVFFFDADRGGEMAVLAAGGRYVNVRKGENSGLNPLKGLNDTPASRDFLFGWIRSLILSDGRDPYPVSDDARLAIGIAAVMRMPVEMRSLEAVRQFLGGWGDPNGAGPRLEPWCRGGPKGWAFDGVADETGFSQMREGVPLPIVGFDLTAILDDPMIADPAGAYLLYQIRAFMDGRRGVAALDEFRKYLLSPTFKWATEAFLLDARKYEWIVALVTQQPEHVLGDRFGATLVGQCMTKIFFPTPTADEDVYLNRLHLTPGEVKAIREGMAPGSRKMLIHREGVNTESVIVNFDLSAMPEYVAVLSGRAKTVREAEKLRAGNSENWVSEFMKAQREAAD